MNRLEAHAQMRLSRIPATPKSQVKGWFCMAVASIRAQITKELADLRFRQLDESPEIKVMDSAKTHGRINLLLDELERAAYAAGWF